MTSPLPWIKVYGDLPTHRKSVTLAALLNEPRAWTYVVELWLWVSRNKPDGHLTTIPDRAIAAVSGWRGDPALFVDALRQSGFLDEDDLHGWHEHNGAHQRKQAADKARNERRASEPDTKINPLTSDSPVNRENLTSVESREYKLDKEQEKNLAIFENQKSATPEPKRRGRPPKDQSPEAQAERQKERDDADRWIAKARALIGLSAEEAPWSSATFMSFRQARKKRGIEQLLRALDGLEGDRWASQQGLAVLLSATLIEKGLARFGGSGAIGINATWEKIFAEGKTGSELPEDF